MSAQGSCPSCGAPVAFRVETSVVAVCGYCRTAVARGDRGFRDLGRFAEIFATPTVLGLGRRGRYEGRAFELVGRTQLQHPQGGVWDEWYARFDDGRWGWLAEAQGALHLTFAALEADGSAPRVPPPAGLRPGVSVDVLGARYVVSEATTATVSSGEGELPFAVEPGRPLPFADLSGPDGAFATIDYGDAPPSVYVGRRVDLADLGMADAPLVERAQKRVEAVRLGCPRCGAPMQLLAPDATERAACPSCAALLDVEDGALRFLREQAHLPRRPLIPLGREGRLLGRDVKVVGFVVKSVAFDGERYTFGEYLLHAGKDGFFWLVESDAHWSFVRPVSAADVHGEALEGVRYDGRRFKPFQTSCPRVEGVLGELTWKVEIGEMTDAVDLIAPPYLLSEERTDTEVTWSLGEYVPVREVEKAFSVDDLETPSRVGPNQPYPLRDFLPAWLVALACALVIGVGAHLAVPSRKVVDEVFDLQAGRKQQTFFLDQIPLKARRNVVVTFSRESGADWAYLIGGFHDKARGRNTAFSLALDGRRATSTRFPAPAGGTYALNLSFDRGDQSAAARFRVRVDQGRPSRDGLLWLLGLVTAIPAIVFLHSRSFEARRMEDSNL